MRKIFLDTGMIYKLSFINKHPELSDKELKQIMLFSTDPEHEDAKMTKNSIAAEKTIQLYHDIKEGRVEPCICSTVYAEVLNKIVKEHKDIENEKKKKLEEGKEYIELPTMKDFVYEYFTLYLPAKEFRKEYISHVYTLQNGLKQNSVQVGSYFYGLNDEAGFDGKPHSDFDDRSILAEMAVISQFTDEKIRVVNFRTLTDEEGIIKYVFKLHGDIGNERRKTQHDKYDVYPTAKEIFYYHFNQADYGTRVKGEAMSDEGYRQATVLENGIQDQLRQDTVKDHKLKINVQHISEYERDL